MLEETMSSTENGKAAFAIRCVHFFIYFVANAVFLPPMRPQARSILGHVATNITRDQQVRGSHTIVGRKGCVSVRLCAESFMLASLVDLSHK